MPAQNPEAASESGMDRRGLMKGAAQLGAAGIAGGLVLNATSASAAAPAQAAPAQAAARTGEAARLPHEPLVVRVTDAATGEMDVFHGDQHRQVTDRELAAALLRHAR
ncbi:hypothetical protein [Streptomyces sp. CA-111067]|uniref:hypothetical protein n=1 Tax=Streptomyces sp. CA-111067 TaxID=3240046 RepID=UPI003D99A8BB